MRVVIAEDEAIIRMDLRETLEEEGYEVVGETGRGDQAIELVRGLQPDLAILDIKMPGMTGLEAAAIINGEKICGVLMLTAFSQKEVVEEARDAGALAFLVKPFQRSDLVPAIEVAMGRFRELRTMTGEIDSLERAARVAQVHRAGQGRADRRAGMSENDAFQFIQKTAMSERTTDARRRRSDPATARFVRNRLRSPNDGYHPPRRRQLADLSRVLRACRPTWPRRAARSPMRCSDSRRCSPTCSRSSSPTASSLRSTGRSRRSVTKPNPEYKAQTRRPHPTSSVSRWDSCARCSMRWASRRSTRSAGKPTISSPRRRSDWSTAARTSSSSPATATATSSSATRT